jgi:thioredoxin-like negative regulator of GroEL
LSAPPFTLALALGRSAAVVRSIPGLAVVEISTPWRPRCRIMRPLLRKLAIELAGHAMFVRVDDERANALVRTFGREAVPQLLLLRDGVVVGQIDGFGSFDELAQALRTFAGAPQPAAPADVKFERAFQIACARMDAFIRPANEAVQPALEAIGPQMDAASAQMKAALGADADSSKLRRRLDHVWEKLTEAIRPQLDALEAAYENALAIYEADMQMALSGYTVAKERKAVTALRAMLMPAGQVGG